MMSTGRKTGPEEGPNAGPETHETPETQASSAAAGGAAEAGRENPGPDLVSDPASELAPDPAPGPDPKADRQAQPEAGTPGRPGRAGPAGARRRTKPARRGPEADAALFEGLALDLPADRFPDPVLALTDPGRAALAEALRASLRKVAGDLDKPPRMLRRQRGPRRRVLLETVIALYDSGLKVECAHLAAASELTHSRVIILWVRALEELRATEALVALIARLEADPTLPAKNRRNLLDLRMHNQSGLMAADMQVFLPGPVPAALADALAALPAPGIDWVPRHMAGVLAGQRGLSGAAAEAFAAELNWGRAAVDLLTFLKYYAWPASGGPQPGQGGPDDAAVRALAGQLRDLVVKPDPNPMVEAARAGRSIVLVSAHAGLPVVAPWIMTDTGLPLIGISAKSPTNLTHPTEKTLGTHGNFQADFLKAVKILRRDPHLVQLLPDGGFGGATSLHRLRGREIPLGQGAATMAWQGRAAVFFFGTRWRADGRLEIYVRPGPVAEAGGDRAAFDAAFHGFYLGCLEDIVAGPARDMAPGGGFWRHLVGEPAQAPGFALAGEGGGLLSVSDAPGAPAATSTAASPDGLADGLANTPILPEPS